VWYGDAAVRRVPSLAAELMAGLVGGSGAGRVLLVCGRASFEASGAAAILPALRRSARLVRWSEFAPNPDATDLLAGLRVAHRLRPDLVLGVGGGSAMDMAKLLCGFDGLTDLPRLRRAIRAGRPVTARRPGLVLVPTTSGSGSEATHFAVVYIGEQKFSVAGPALRPDAVVLDPSLSRSGSAYQRATSGIDAVCQAVESLWAVGATDASRRWARWALSLLLPAIEQYVAAPTPESARAMAIGSHLAGRAIDISKTTAAHALSYPITTRYGVAHGHAVALTLGGFIEAHGAADPARLRPPVLPADLAIALDTVVTAFGAADPADAGRRFVALARRLGLSMRAAELGIDVDGLRSVAAGVNAVRLGNNPVAYSEDELATLLVDSETADRG
jgi:alcohol dehydrogenase class IV